MSRRPNPAADRAEQNRATLKNLVKLEGNKTCSDCKRNKHPRWASWNLGVFICIRCSGIHRGMGTHISKVKSVDLDTWTDEQLQSVLKWGNARANKYWEAKLAPGHVPSEAKIENFIRTKYESKRWVMDGPLPDPATLGEDDDDMVLQPLSKVQEKIQVERSASQRLAGNAAASRPPPQAKPAPVIDLFGDATPAPPRSSTGPPPATRAPPPKAEPAPPKQTKAGDSLLGLDFLGSSSTPPARPSSTGPAGAAAAPSRPDLKQSILSLYASAPKAAAQPQPQQQQQQQHARQTSFGGLATPQSQLSPTNSAFGGMNDAFGSLSFNAAPAPAPKPSPFSGLDAFSSAKSPSASSNMFGGGGNFFDSKPKSPPVQNRTTSPSAGFSNFSSFNTPAASKPAAPSSGMGGMGDLLDLSMPSAPAQQSFSQQSFSQQSFSPAPPAASAFSLAPAAPKPSQSVNYGNMDAWGSNDAWGSAPSQPAAPAQAPAPSAPAKSPAWGGDDDFGGWSSAAPAASNAPAPGAAPATTGKQGGFGGNDDLFSNVWE
ncbi:hypothetical protein C7974DRAFT_433781 [Boeremia exigua]|uniref:uncharacterized protein n=1 Tax=Boeremia exigua TaxID=749465 RepID=UPI001E8E89EF|nr:uncharacterized protein C7974DRAFT_433781 [Boeremia exigua]KAH6629065.1 hypothetical protein C7974DRAFT_433781 [Boeremia exigua]